MNNKPSDAEIEKLAAEHLKAFAQFTGAGDVWVEGGVAFARAVLAKWGTPQPAPADLEQLRERIARMGLDVDRAMRGHVNEQSPLGTQRLAAIAALVKPKPAPLSAHTASRRRDATDVTPIPPPRKKKANA